MAEEVRFELTVGCPTLVFKTSAIDHSATPPVPRRYTFFGIFNRAKEVAPGSKAGAIWLVGMSADHTIIDCPHCCIAVLISNTEHDVCLILRLVDYLDAYPDVGGGA